MLVICFLSAFTYTAAARSDATLMMKVGEQYANPLPRSCYFVDDYGADPLGVKPSDAAVDTIKTLIAATSTSQQVCLQFGPGSYTFAKQLDFTVESPWNISIQGAGQAVTRLRWSHFGGGLRITINGYSAVTISNLSLTTDVRNGGSALILRDLVCGGPNTSPSVIENVLIGGTNAVQTDPKMRPYWTYGIEITSVSFVNVQGLTFLGSDRGTGILYKGTPTCVAIVLNVIASNFLFGESGIFYGDQAEGMSVSQSNFTNGRYGIVTASGASRNFQLNVSDSQFDVTETPLSLTSFLSQVSVHDNLIYVAPGKTGIYINGGGHTFSLSHNIFANRANQYGVGLHTANGIAVHGNLPCPVKSGGAPQCPTTNGELACNRGVISGNIFSGFEWGVVLNGPKAQGWSVMSNGYDNNSNGYGNSGICNTIGALP